MRLLKGLMACMAALFFLGYVNSCDTEASSQFSDNDDTEIQHQESKENKNISS